MLGPENLHKYQRDAVAFITQARQGAVFLPPGLGKTVTALTWLADLFPVKPALILAPASVVEGRGWEIESDSWSHTRHLRTATVDGSPANRDSILSEVPADAYVLSYDNLVWLFEWMKTERLADWFSVVIMDELTKLKAPGTSRFKKLRHQITEVPYRLGLTGTPSGDGNWLDLWAMLYACAGEKPLGPTHTAFEQFFSVPDWSGYHRTLITERLPILKSRIRPYTFSRPTPPEVIQPRAIINKIRVTLPEAARDAMRSLERELYLELGNGKEIEALHAGSLGIKLRQMSSGAVYHKDEFATGALVPIQGALDYTVVHDAKIKALKELVESQNGEPLLVFCAFQHEFERIQEAIPGAKHLTPDLIPAWNRGEIAVGYAHPASMGYGHNLQKACSAICWFTLTWSLEQWKQANARVVRQGSPFEEVVVHYLDTGKSDALVMQKLLDKEAVEQEVFQATGETP